MHRGEMHSQGGSQRGRVGLTGVAGVQAWSACVDANRGEGHNFTEECADATLALQGCMEAHRDYYKDFMLDPDFNEPNKAEESGADAAAAPDAAPEAQGGGPSEHARRAGVDSVHRHCLRQAAVPALRSCWRRAGLCTKA